jgi:hypothetical protein
MRTRGFFSGFFVTHFGFYSGYRISLISQPLNYVNILIINNLFNKNAVFLCKFCIFKV